MPAWGGFVGTPTLPPASLSGASGSLAPTWDASQPHSSGDQLAVAVGAANANNVAPTCTTPTGWTLDANATFNEAVSTNRADVWLFRRVADGGVNDSPTFTIGNNGAGGTSFAIPIEMWGIVTGGTPSVFVPAGNSGANFALTVSSATPAWPCLIVSNMCMRGSALGSFAWTGPMTTYAETTVGTSPYISVGTTKQDSPAAIAPGGTAVDTGGQGAIVAIAFQLQKPPGQLVLPTAAVQRASNR